MRSNNVQPAQHADKALSYRLGERGVAQRNHRVSSSANDNTGIRRFRSFKSCMRQHTEAKSGQTESLVTRTRDSDIVNQGRDGQHRSIKCRELPCTLHVVPTGTSTSDTQPAIAPSLLRREGAADTWLQIHSGFERSFAGAKAASYETSEISFSNTGAFELEENAGTAFHLTGNRTQQYSFNDFSPSFLSEASPFLMLRKNGASSAYGTVRYYSKLPDGTQSLFLSMTNSIGKECALHLIHARDGTLCVCVHRGSSVSQTDNTIRRNLEKALRHAGFNHVTIRLFHQWERA